MPSITPPINQQQCSQYKTSHLQYKGHVLAHLNDTQPNHDRYLHLASLVLATITFYKNTIREIAAGLTFSLHDYNILIGLCRFIPQIPSFTLYHDIFTLCAKRILILISNAIIT